MAEPTLHFVDCPDSGPGHRMAYWLWGATEAQHTVVCAHGLSRQGRDFDVLARALVERAHGDIRVVCPDVAGRGHSDWLADPAGYQVVQYVMDMMVMLNALQPRTLDWVGTSMGGLIGMGVCAHLSYFAGQQPAGDPGLAVRRLVLNDIGPTVQWASIERISSYLGQAAVFSTEEQAVAALWSISSSFGPHTPEQWLALSRPMLRPATGSEGGFTLHYDPAIALPFRSVTREVAAQGEALLWAAYDAIAAKTLLLRGADSDLLSAETAHAMCSRGPKARLVEFEGVGHAPTLIATDQVDLVSTFLLE